MTTENPTKTSKVENLPLKQEKQTSKNNLKLQNHAYKCENMHHEKSCLMSTKFSTLNVQ